MAQQASEVKNIGGFIVKAIRENYNDPVFQARLEERKQREQQGLLDSLESEMLEKKNALLRQAVRANPELLEQAVDRIQSHIIKERLAQLSITASGIPRRRYGDCGNQCYPRRCVLHRAARTAL